MVIFYFLILERDCRSHDRMVVGFTPICAISEVWVRFKLTATCDKSIWISLGFQFPPPILTGHDIAEILLKVALNAIIIYIYSILYIIYILF
jgi:hypothetical protein